MAYGFHRIRQTALLSAAGIALLAGHTAAQAQDAVNVEEIVVTGTLIRGVAPVGSNVISISQDEIRASGAIDNNQLLATLPQSSYFLDLPEPGNGAIQAGTVRLPVIPPNLRGFQSGSGIPTGPITLVLLDGNRVVPAGLEQSQVDAGVVPSGILERQETILDGASAIYGSDAVGGVINYIPRKRFDGTMADATYGFADDYYAVSANVTSGKSWETGGIGFTYSFSKASNVLDRDRDHQTQRNWFEGGRVTGTACDDYGHITASGRTFVSTSLAERTNWCFPGWSTYTPALDRHSGFMVFSQDITDAIRFETTAFYSKRTTTQNSGPATATVTVRSTNPYFRSLTQYGIANSVAQSVAFSFGPVLGNDFGTSASTVEMGQVTPSLAIDVGSDWELRTSFAYGKSLTRVHQRRNNTTMQATYAAGTTLTTAINPYDIAATQNRALIGDLVWFNLREGYHKFLQARAVADGPVFTLPGGEVRAAFGAEWSKTDFTRRATDATTHLVQPFEGATSKTKGVFAEVVAPIVGPDNSRTGIHSLTASASGRWDDYGQFGDTFNPKFQLAYEPVDWITVRGTWGKSFRAPNAVDKLGTDSARVACIGPRPGCTSTLQIPPGVTTTVNDVYINMGGTQPNVGPEKSTNWSLGLDVKPPIVPGLTVSPSFYKIDFTDQLNIPNPGASLQPIFLYAPELWTLLPTPAQIDAFAALAPSTGPSVVDFIRTSGYRVLFLVDTRIRNLAGVRISGFDLAANYVHPTSWGSFNARFNGNWQLKRNTQVFTTSPVVDQLATGLTRYRMTVSVGATYGDFTANAILQHQAGFSVENPALYAGQTTIDQFDLVNLNFRWNVNGAHPLTEDLSLTLVINNVLDTDPPVSRTNNGSTANGNTLGRLIQFGVSKKF